MRAPTSAEVVDLFLKENLEVAANVKQVLTGYARSNPGVRMIEPGFMTIAQAMGVPQGRPAAFAFVEAFVEEMKASGFVAEALEKHKQPDAAVAPAGKRP